MESTRGLYLQGNMHLLIYPDHTKAPFKTQIPAREPGGLV